MMNSSWSLLAAIFGILFVFSSTNGEPSSECQSKNEPLITPCKKEVILENGHNYTLKCQANSPVEFIKEEEREENMGTFDTTHSYFVNESAEYKYETSLELQNVDKYAIGYYACVRTNSSVYNDSLNSLVDEPNNTENISYIYIYVNGTDSLYAPMREFVVSKKDFYNVECRPTTPDIEVNIFLTDIAENTPFKGYSPKIGFIYDSDTLDALTDIVTIFTCGFKKQHRTAERDQFFIKRQREQPNHTVDGTYEYFLSGETFSLNCTVEHIPNKAVTLDWILPDTVDKSSVTHKTNNDTVKTSEDLYYSITIHNAAKNHEGIYTCMANSQGKNFKKTFLEEPILDIWCKDPRDSDNTILVEALKQPTCQKDLVVTSYPPASFSLFKNNSLIKNDIKKASYEIKSMGDAERRIGKSRVVLKVKHRDVEDSGKYTLVAHNGNKTENITFNIKFSNMPVMITANTTKECELNTTISLVCEVTGYPFPAITWSDESSETYESTSVITMSEFRAKAILQVKCLRDKTITCKAHEDSTWKMQKPVTQVTKLLVNEITNGFGMNVSKKNLRIAENETAAVKCMASLHKFKQVTWEFNGTDAIDKTEPVYNSTFSLVSTLKLNSTSQSDSGVYVCRGILKDGTIKTQEINIIVDALLAPEVVLKKRFGENVDNYQPIHVNCTAQGVPLPTIEWYKDGEEFNPDQNITNSDTNKIIYTYEMDYKTVSSLINITQMKAEYQGNYECKAINRNGESKKQFQLILTKSIEEAAYKKYVIAIVVIFVLLIAVVVFLVIKLRRDKAKRARLRKELMAAGLLYFKEGQSQFLNPELGIDEQAELLPYDEKFEFPQENLKLVHQLGAGAFGVVYKAEARGIINAEETTLVAVKMVKRTADNVFIKALATELKIMVHLGKHVNIVNLLGACTKNVGKRELSVIVEYCKFGNIHNYMQKHREVFIDQFSDSKEKNFGNVNRGYDSSGSTRVQSEYGTANTQDTDHTFLTNNTNRTSRKNVRSQPPEVAKASEGYIMQPEWRSNYESDYSYDGRAPRPLTSRDLLAWAFQIARGMEYLANRKILHGDLAARNILLAEDNVVKICDFGLARSIIKNDEYKKKENSLVPVKWLAIECMTDRIFSTQSDVWSFGVVLWELFTLAKTPYANMDHHNLLQFLRVGHRLEKPPYSDDRIYDLMKRCWQEKPSTRPTFSQLQEELGNFLEDDVRNKYIDLNNVYKDINTLAEGQEDYLAMVSAPDYNNVVTPSPHIYVNETRDSKRFFPPTPTKVDEDGYLQMTPKVSASDIFSPKCTATRFDFEPRKLNSRPSEASSVGSELTPMLSLTNVPRSGSDSDQEGESSVFPFANPRCPTINEETVDDVFSSKENVETFNKNAKNAQNTAVTNPTYITFDLDVEKKPKDVINYMNIQPNGLVK